jgi:hypothetical protein
MKKVGLILILCALAMTASQGYAATGLTIDVTGPGGISVKQVQPGLFTGEIWATMTGVDPELPEGLNTVTGGLQLTGGGTFLPFDKASNYEDPWISGSHDPYVVDSSADGKTLGHGGLMSFSPTSGVLYFHSMENQVGNGPFKLGTFQANLQAGDSVQFLLSGTAAPMYRFTVDGSPKLGSANGLVSVGEPLVAVPEPSTFALIGIGIFGLVGFCWRRRK